MAKQNKSAPMVVVEKQDELQPVDLGPELTEHIRRLNTEPDYRDLWRDRVATATAEDARRTKANPPTPAYQRGGKDDPQYYWPKAKALPNEYIRGNAPPCINCRCVRMDNGSQAVLLLKTDKPNNLAYFRCRRCGGNFKLSIIKIIYG